jgi:hypothetical protein
VNDELLLHLHAPYRAYALLSASERIQWIRQDRWIHYSWAEEVLNRLSDLLTYPARDRMHCLLLFGQPGWEKPASSKSFCASIDQALTTSLEERRCPSSPFRCRRLPVSATFMRNCWLAWVLFYPRTKALRPYGNALGVLDFPGLKAWA